MKKPVKQYHKNPRKISEKQFADLRDSLQELGDLSGIVVNVTTNEVLSGNQRSSVFDINECEIVRTEVFKQPDEQGTVALGYVIWREKKYSYREVKWDEKTCERAVIVANKLGGEWDNILLAEFEASDLLDWGFTDTEIANMEVKNLDETEGAKEDNFEVPDKIETDIVLGDLFEIGNHRLLCGDSTNSESVARLMNGEKADMVFTDPPYNVKVNSIVNSGKIKHPEFIMGSGEMSKSEFISFLTCVFANLVQHSKDGSIHFVCMDWRHIFEIITAGDLYTELKQLCIWNKDIGGMGTFYRSKHELIFVFKNGKNKHINTFELGQHGRYRTNVWDYAGVNSFARSGDLKYHPTVKPVKLVSDAVMDCSLRGMIVADFFLGSGTTMISCEETERVCYGMELDPKYCDVIVTRMLKLDKTLTVKRNGVDETQKWLSKVA